MHSLRTALALCALALPLARAGATPVRGDFNGDGYADLAIGAESEDLGPAPNAGEVHVLYGSRGGLTTRTSQLWNQDSSGIVDNPQPDDVFGRVLATGDFNGDGRADLAIGVPGEEVVGVPHAGAVHVLYGTGKGLSAVKSQFFTQDSPRIADQAEAGDGFGNALASGDFNGDGYADLAIGAPAESTGVNNAIWRAGAVHVLYGTASGLIAATRGTYWMEGLNGIPGAPESNDLFGMTLAAGDFDGDGCDELVIGAPSEADDQDPSIIFAGVAYVLRGAPSGLTSTGVQVIEQTSGGMAPAKTVFARVGSTLRTGDFNGDGRDDLALGVEETVGNLLQAGAVDVIYGSPTGLDTTGFTKLTEIVPGIEQPGVQSDLFGQALSDGDFNGDGITDLAVGAWDRTVSGHGESGAVRVFFGAPAGLNAKDGVPAFSDVYLDRDTPGVEGVAATKEWFGSALASGDFDGNGCDDLATGLFGWKVGAGAVQVFPSTPSGFDLAKDTIWTEDTPNVGGVAEAGDSFGLSLGN